MENWIIGIMEQFGYIGILLLITLENIFPPIPSEVILTFGGFMTTQTKLTILGTVIVSTLGSVLGAVILFGIGLFFDIHRMEKIIDRWGYILRLTRQDLYKANRWFLKYGIWTVFFCRFIPLIRSLISLPAGMARMNFGTFLLFTTVGTLIWNFVLINIGAMVGESWEAIVGYMDIYSNIVYAVLVILFMGCVSWFVKKRITNTANILSKA